MTGSRPEPRSLPSLPRCASVLRGAPLLPCAASMLLAMLAGCDGRGAGASPAGAGTPDSASARYQAVPSGWTPLTPTSATRHVYVSSSSGNDNNSGLTEQSPKATIQAAMVLLRQASPDWL